MKTTAQRVMDFWFKLGRGVGIAAFAVFLVSFFVPQVRHSRLFPFQEAIFVLVSVVWLVFYRLSAVRKFRDYAGNVFREESGQDIAEYAVLLAVILIIVVGSIRLIGASASNIFSQVKTDLDGTPTTQTQ
jgi:Flp pilus assembly pilin Flp